MKKQEFDLDKVLTEVGQFGRFQIRSYLLILIGIIFCALYNSQFIFAAASVKSRCRVPECESNPPIFDTQDWGKWALPEGGGRCERFLPVGTTCVAGSFHPSQTKKCSSWVYENHNSIVATFDIACEDWKRTLVGTIHSAGLFVALPLTAFISDNFGRRIAFISTAVAPAFVGVARSFTQSYAAYVSLEFLDAVVGAGVYSSGFILALEMMGLQRRVLGGNIISCTFAIGQALGALIAWAIPEWRTLTRILYAPSVLFILYFCLIEESIRWLLSKGKKKEATRIIYKVAAVNNKKLSPETIRQLSEESTSQNAKSSADVTLKEPSLLLQVFKSRVIMSRLFICSFWWITVTFIYYGLSINSVSLAGNSYVNYILTALVEIPGYCVSVLTLDRFGRKSSIMVAFFICGISLVCLPFIPYHLQWLQTCLNLLGKLCISMAFSSIYIYTSELYPTTIRQSLLSICSMCGRIGQIVAPQTPLLIIFYQMTSKYSTYTVFVTILLTMLGKLAISMVFSSVYIYTIELFPTEARHSMMAFCSMVGRLGTTSASMTPLLMAYMASLPYLVFGVMAGTAGLLMLLTPETLHIKLPDTVKQAENIASAPRTKRPTDVIVD